LLYFVQFRVVFMNVGSVSRFVHGGRQTRDLFPAAADISTIGVRRIGPHWIPIGIGISICSGQIKSTFGSC
jgi:hypothetical protein